MSESLVALTTVQALNKALCAALGVPNVDFCRSVTLVIRPDALPTITAEFYLHTPAGLQRAMQQATITPMVQGAGDAA